MRVLNYIGTLPPGSLSGEVMVAKNDMKSLNLAGHVAIQYDISRFNNGLINKLLRPIRLFVFPYEIYYIRKKIKSFQPDIVHLHTVTPYVSISLLIYLAALKMPIIQTLHNVRWVCLEGAYYREGRYCDKCSGKNGFSGVVNRCNKNVARSLILFFINRIVRVGKFLFKSVTYFMPVSDFVRREHLLNGFPADKLVTKSNSIDLENLPNILKGDCRREGVVFASRVSKSKGSDVLKVIMTEIIYPIYVIGDGPELIDLKGYCISNKYNHVYFLGKVSQQECLTHMASALCTIVPSQCGESFSLVAAESMALGTPVVGSDIGGLGSLLKKAGGGIAVQYNNPKFFIDAISNLIDNPVLAGSLGKAGREYVEEELNAKRNAEKLIAIYNNALKERRGNASLI